MIKVFLRESIKTTLTLAVMLRDAYSRRDVLLGDIEVKVTDVETAERKPLESTFIFSKLPNGAHNIQIRSLEDPPLYLPVDLAVTLPVTDPLWPAFPDARWRILRCPSTALFKRLYFALSTGRLR